MTTHRHRHRASHGGNDHHLLTSIAVVAVTAFAGYMLVANIDLNRDTVATTNTRELIEKRQDRANALTTEIHDLSVKLDAARELNGNITDWNVPPTVQDTGSDTMLPKVEGPGISVQLNDSQYSLAAMANSNGSADANDYVVHQQDIEAVVDALWHGGAEAMTIQGVRVENTTAVRCVGNVLLLNGHTYSPPYTVQAIGSYDGMKAALDSSPTIHLYLEYVKQDGLGWKVSQEDTLVFDETPSSLQTLNYAKPTDENALGNDSSADASSADQPGTSASGASSDASASVGVNPSAANPSAASPTTTQSE